MREVVEFSNVRIGEQFYDNVSKIRCRRIETLTTESGNLINAEKMDNGAWLRMDDDDQVTVLR